MTESKKNIIKPDVIQKQYWRNKDAFADFFNSLLFGGKEFIKAANHGMVQQACVKCLGCPMN